MLASSRPCSGIGSAATTAREWQISSASAWMNLSARPAQERKQRSGRWRTTAPKIAIGKQGVHGGPLAAHGDENRDGVPHLPGRALDGRQFRVRGLSLGQHPLQHRQDAANVEHPDCLGGEFRLVADGTSRVKCSVAVGQRGIALSQVRLQHRLEGHEKRDLPALVHIVVYMAPSVPAA